MSLARLDATQLADIRATYEQLLADPNGDTEEKLVAQARLKEVQVELDRRRFPASGNGSGHGKNHNRWPQVDLVALIRESGCQLQEKGESKYVGDHSVKHSSKSGLCLVVWLEQGFWYCTSCKAGGDAAEWVAQIDGCDWKTAAKQLRERFGVGTEGESRERPPSQATALVGLAKGCATFFHTPELEAYATFRVGNHRETWGLKTRAIRRWLQSLYYSSTGATPNAQALQDALGVLEGEALFVGPEHPVFVRLAEQGDIIYLDLCNDGWEVVEISPSGWRVAVDPPVKFRRPRGALPLPRPVAGGSIEELRTFLNIENDTDWKLTVGCEIAAFRPRGPYPVLCQHGEQGSGKSTRTRVLKALVDPSTVPLRSEPRELRDLAITAANGWALAFDNLSHLPVWLSDALCRLSTGGGFATRELYSDSEEALFDAQRPVILTGIEDIVTRSDLLDRSIILNLPQIADTDRKPEVEFWQAFEEAQPRILGAFLDAVSGALQNLPKVKLTRLPRMADFALWVTAAETALGWKSGDFLAAYAGNREAANDLALEASPVAVALRAFMEDREEWRGTPTDLLTDLGGQVSETTKKEKAWPKAANALTGALKRVAPNLRAVGIHLNFKQRESGSGKRLIAVTKLKGSPPNGSPSRDSRDGCDDLSTGSSVQSPIGLEKAEAPAVAIDAIRTSTKNTVTTVTDRHVERETGLFCDDPVTICDDPASSRSIGSSQNTGEIERENGRCDSRDDCDSLLPTHSKPIVQAVDAPQFRLLTTTEAARGILPDIITAPVVGLDLETTGLDPHRDRIRLVQLATPKQVFMVDGFKVDLGVLRPVFDSQTLKVIHNAKFDLGFLLAQGFGAQNVFDTLLADQVLRGSRNFRSLADVTSEYLGIKLDKSLQVSDWSGNLSGSQLTYAAQDAATLLPLHEKLDAAIREAKLERCLRIENRCVPAMAWVEHSGAPFDGEAWRKLADAALLEKLKLERELNAIAQEALGANTLFGRETNWEAVPQVLEILRGLGFDVTTTTEEVLVSLSDRHPIIAKILAHRELAKRVGTYGLNVLGDVHPVTGRIHADWRQIGADSGRMACTRPNLQNVPRTPAYRACFKAPEGRVLVKADYSQIELRIAAEISGDRRMLEAYKNGADLHILTAQAILGKQDVTKDDRQIAKSANFGLLYGMGAPAFQSYAQTNYGVSLSLEQATRIRETFFQTYPGLRVWHRRQPGKDTAIDTRTLAGRRRRGVLKFTEKLNTPVQGSGADGLKGALALLWENHKRCPSAFPVLVVHDEIVIECDAGEAESAKAWLTDCMVRGMGHLLRQVPVEVEAQIISDWSGTPSGGAN